MTERADYPRFAQRRLQRQRPAGRLTRRATSKHYLRTNAPETSQIETPTLQAVAVVPDLPRIQPEPVVAPAASLKSGEFGPESEVTTQSDVDSSFLQGELGRLRQEQRRTKKKRLIHLPTTKLGMIALAIPLILLISAGAILGPVIYRATVAYDKVFVDPPPRTEPRFAAVKNPEGTPVIATATATTVAAIQIPEWDGKTRLTMLLMGVDRREEEPSRSDTMILVEIDPVAKTASMLAIPRDLKVIIPGYGEHKVNAAYAFADADKLQGGGPGLVIQTIESNFGIRIDYFAEVDFNGFVKILNTLGGVTVDVPYPIKDDEYPADGNNYMRVYFSAGWQHMDGARALQYARTRHDDGDGRRSVRQQQVLMALRDQAIGLNLLPKAGELLAEIGDSVRTDLPPSKALQLARLASEIAPDSIKSFTLDSALTEDNGPDGYYLDADWDVVGQILSQFTGTDVTPPMSALANPKRDVPIRVENGTFNTGLGERVAALLEADGFTNVSVVDRQDAGANPLSTLTSYQPDLATAYLAAGLVGIGLDSVSVPGTAGANPNPSKTGIVILLGDDARDPAYYSAEPDDDLIVTDGTTPVEPIVDETTGDDTGSAVESIADDSVTSGDAVVPDDTVPVESGDGTDTTTDEGT